jgi:hypothetical protein
MRDWRAWFVFGSSRVQILVRRRVVLIEFNEENSKQSTAALSHNVPCSLVIDSLPFSAAICVGIWKLKIHNFWMLTGIVEVLFAIFVSIWNLH